MPKRYDSVACVSELVAKAKVCSSVCEGWSPVGPGCLPEKVPPRRVEHEPDPQRPCKAPKSSPSLGAHPCSQQSAQPIMGDFNTSSMLGGIVMNLSRGKLHLHLTGAWTLCRLWKCGTVEAPQPDAQHLEQPPEKKQFTWCKACCNSKLASIFPKWPTECEKDAKQLVQLQSSSESSV